MPNSNTLIKLKRTDKGLNTLIELEDKEPLQYGEPLFLSSEDSENSLHKNDLIAIGNNGQVTAQIVDEATYFSGVTDIKLAGKAVYYQEDPSEPGNTYIVNKNNQLVGTAKVSPKVLSANLDLADKKFEILTTCEAYQIDEDTTVEKNTVHKYGELYLTGNGVLVGGAWNDYAEHRICSGVFGQVVCEQGDGTLKPSTERLQILPHVVTDTCGMIIGEKGAHFKPIAVAGRALVKVNCKVCVGDVLCADKDGFATVMTRNEIASFPDRILGIVSEIPTYDTWNDVYVDGRVWIKVK